ncbi:MAG: dihydropteroate synthase [Candidatus Thorarchaeota archaeon]|nr:MAG: dihydropteroate synthase [Candidatus Thorarchaeota archaeon]
MGPHTVKVGEIELGSSYPVCVMGVLNLSPESFYPGSVATTEDEIKERVEILEREGADIIDIGGASTAPESVYGTRTVTEDQELERVVSALGVIRQTTDLPLSIDTTSSKVAEKVVGLGASLVNDTSGFRNDPTMAKLVADLDVPVILMAMCEKPCGSVTESVHALRESIQIAQDAGVNEGNLIVDPGIGFGKPAQTDYALLRELPRFAMFGHPVLVGVSRKAFIGELLELSDVEDRLIGSVAATSIAVARGADVVRAHDVREAKMAAKVGETLRKTLRGIGKGMELINICDEREAEIVIEQVGVQSGIRQALSRKAVTLNLLLRNVRTPAALIIKQEMLALGGDAAYHHDTIDSGVDVTDVLVMGTPIHFDKLVKKLGGMDYFGIDKTAAGMQDLLNKRERR